MVAKKTPRHLNEAAVLLILRSGALLLHQLLNMLVQRGIAPPITRRLFGFMRVSIARSLQQYQGACGGIGSIVARRQREMPFGPVAVIFLYERARHVRSLADHDIETPFDALHEIHEPGIDTTDLILLERRRRVDPHRAGAALCRRRDGHRRVQGR